MCKKQFQSLATFFVVMLFISTNLMAQSPRGPKPGGRGGGPTQSWVPYFRYNEAIPDSITFRQTIAKFKQLSYQDAATGIDLPYNLYVPKDYDPQKQYPLVLFMHDASVTGREVTATLTQGLGAVIWASDYEQKKHPCFVLAPQYATNIANDQNETSPAVDATVNLIASLQKQYPIDANRIYTTGQSGGCMASIALNIKYPELFAASYLCSGQWEPTVTAPLAKMNIWISVAEGDMRAYPGMNAITELLQTKGATLTKEYISARSTDEQLNFKVQEMLAKHTNINYLVLSDVVPKELSEMRGAPDHMCSWLHTYSIEAIRDWLFSQRKGIALSDKLQDKDNKDVLLAADMGDWHGTVENSLRSIEKAVEKDAAIVPIDLQLTKDGELILMRDDSLNRLMYVEGKPVYVKDLTIKELRRYAYRKSGNDLYTDKVVPTLADAISFSQGKILLLIKNASPYMNQIAETVQRLGAEKMVIVGGMEDPATDHKGLMFMPVVNLDSFSAMSRLQAWLSQKPVAVELRFANRANALLPQAIKQTLPVCRVAFDISGKGYAGSFRDMTHDDKPAELFDPMIATGASIFISNEVKPFSRYLKGDPNLWRPGK